MSVSVKALYDYIQGYTSTVTDGGDLYLTNNSDNIQCLTGTNTHSVILPDVTTMIIGIKEFVIINTSTQDILIKSSGLNVVCTVHPNNTVNMICTSNSGTDASSWNYSVSTNATASYFSAYNNGVSIVNINTTWTDIPWSTTDIIDSNFIFTNNTSSIEIGRTGDYEINVDLTMYVASGSGSSIIPLEMRILKNGTYLDGTKVLSSLSTVGNGTNMHLKVIKSFVAGDTISVQCIKQTGNRVISLYPDGCRIVLQRLIK